MYEYLDEKYKENETKGRKIYPVYCFFISLFLLMLVLVLSKFVIFKNVLTCDEIGCSYIKYNLYGQEIYNKKFTRAGIKKLYVSQELHRSYKNKNDYYEDIYNVVISESDEFRVFKEVQSFL